MIIITGIGRSGSSVIAQWLGELGLLNYSGEITPQTMSGYEPKDVYRLNNAIWIGNDAPLQSISVQEKMIREVDYPIFKDNNFMYGSVLDRWLSVREDMKFLVTLRNFNDVEKSKTRAGQLNKIMPYDDVYKSAGKFFSKCILKKLKFEYLAFPDFLDAYDEVYYKIRSLDPDLDLDYDEGYDAWVKIVDKNMTTL